MAAKSHELPAGGDQSQSFSAGPVNDCSWRKLPIGLIEAGDG